MIRFEETDAKERLKGYIERDEIYEDYKKDKLMNASDFEKFCIQHCKDIEELLEENQELKKQIEELELQNFNLREDVMIKKMSLPNEKIKDKTFFDLYDMPTYENLLTQQKEFIKYLEDEIKKLKESDIYQPLQRMALATLEHNLQKYKEIIGDDK